MEFFNNAQSNLAQFLEQYNVQLNVNKTQAETIERLRKNAEDLLAENDQLRRGHENLTMECQRLNQQLTKSTGDNSLVMRLEQEIVKAREERAELLNELQQLQAIKDSHFATVKELQSKLRDSESQQLSKSSTQPIQHITNNINVITINGSQQDASSGPKIVDVTNPNQPQILKAHPNGMIDSQHQVVFNPNLDGSVSKTVVGANGNVNTFGIDKSKSVVRDASGSVVKTVETTNISATFGNLSREEIIKKVYDMGVSVAPLVGLSDAELRVKALSYGLK